MANQFSQLVASTYDGVVNERNKAADQWSESAFLNYLDKKGGIKRTNGGSTLELTLDFQQNAGADFLATDSTTTSTSKTTILDAASYSYIPLVVPVNWTLTDEALNSDPYRKVDLVTHLVDNAIKSHDQAIETAMMAATGGTDGFNTLIDLLTEDGTGTVGGIVAGTETWWKNKFKDYDAAATLLADMRTLYSSCAKGSGGAEPNVIVGGATEFGVYEGKLIANQRYLDPKTATGGFSALKFANADVVFSPAATNDSYFFINTDFLKLYVVRSAWRSRKDPVEHINAAMTNMKVFSVVQLATSARSRCGVLFT
jgi:hypothetical protein